MLLCLLLVIPFTVEAVFFQPVEVKGRVSDSRVVENSGLAASRRHAGLLYGHNDNGDTNRILIMNPYSGNILAELTIANVANYDWEDICVGTCGPNTPGSCIYIGEIGDHGGDGAKNIVYKVKEPDFVRNSNLVVLDTLRFTWNQSDAESLIVDPEGELYIISKESDGDALFARLPASGWGSATPVPISSDDMVRMNLHTSHHDPRAADLSPNGRALLVKTEENVFFYSFSHSMDYLSELAGLTPLNVDTYIRRRLGEAVAWNMQGTGFYTLPEGHHPVFNYYTVTPSAEEQDIIG